MISSGRIREGFSEATVFKQGTIYAGTILQTNGTSIFHLRRQRYVKTLDKEKTWSVQISISERPTGNKTGGEAGNEEARLRRVN